MRGESDRFRTEPYTIYYPVVHSNGLVGTMYGTGWRWVERLPRTKGEEDER